MNMPSRYRPGSMLERAFPAMNWGSTIASEFDDLYSRMGQLLETAGTLPAAGSEGNWAPLADIHETDDAYVVEAELPGVKREDIDVEIGNRDLSITGEYRQCEREGVLRRTTRRTGRFEYRTLLPADVKTDAVTANLTDGVLTVTVPKVQAAKPQHIEITT